MHFSLLCLYKVLITDTVIMNNDTDKGFYIPLFTINSRILNSCLWEVPLSWLNILVINCSINCRKESPLNYMHYIVVQDSYFIHINALYTVLISLSINFFLTQCDNCVRDGKRQWNFYRSEQNVLFFLCLLWNFNYFY